MSVFVVIACGLFGFLMLTGQAVGDFSSLCVNIISDIEKQVQAICRGQVSKLVYDVEELMRRTGELAAEDQRLAAVHQHLTAEYQRLAAEDQRLDAVDEGLLNESEVLAGRGAVYTRWGRTVCPDSSELLYSGYAGGSKFSKGGGADYLCLPTNPQTTSKVSGMQNCGGRIYGAEYQSCSSNEQLFSTDKDQDVPCAVCHAAPRLSHVFIPARTECPANWTKEYQGYTVSGHQDDERTTWVCMDANPEAVPGGDDNDNGALFYLAETRCGSLPCPPYVEGDEITCVVCTK